MLVNIVLAYAVKDNEEMERCLTTR